MTKTQALMLTAVRERLDEATAGQWNDTELRRWINQGARDICRRTEALHTVTQTAVTAGDSTYTAPTDVIRISRVEWQPDASDSPIYGLEYRDFNAMDPIWWTQQSISQSTPQFWTTTGFPPSLTIKLYPTPPEAGFINIHYYKYPAELSTTGSDAAVVLAIPEGWDDAVTDYVEYMALRKDRDPRWQEAKQLYEEHVDTLYTLSRRWSDQPGQIVPEHPYLPQWLYGG